MDAPTVIGVLHEPRFRLLIKNHYRQKLRASAQELIGLLKQRVGRKTRLFVEGHRKGFERLWAWKSATEPFYHVLEYAKANNIEVVPLDNDRVMEVGEHLPSRTTLENYFVFNFRESQWATLAKKMGVTGFDLFVVHPNHVSGLKAELERVTGQKPAVVWINRPAVHLRKDGFHRLGKAELAGLKLKGGEMDRIRRLSLAARGRHI